MSRILVTGIATLDIINQVDHYPSEDEELRATAQQMRRGGNAANTCSVLKQLGDDCRLACTLADDPAGHFIHQDISRRDIEFDESMIIDDSVTPTSYITLNRENGSRTIVHYRDLAELTMAQFDRLDLGGYHWFHFEGRNPAETRVMMLKAAATGKPLSVEAEKQRPGLDQLLEPARLIMFSRAFAESMGFDSARACLAHYAARYPDRTLTCTWGADGAYALDKGELLHSPAFPPERIVDTIGAGDTFNGGLIHALSKGHELHMALQFACRLAGRKCGLEGFDQLGNVHV